jgi:mannose-1-phosphate guanylyltransferase
MLHAVIMAGGAGTRFWPASRANTPKQLLALGGGQTLIQATAARLAGLIPPVRILVVTNERLVTAVREQLPELPAAAVLGEPCKRDTAPCIGLAAVLISQVDPEATLVVMPADHVISTDEQFRAAIGFAAKLVEARPERIVTFGIRPTYPAESFGYIERGEQRLAEADRASNIPSVYAVKKFREKPKAEMAREFLATGRFYWNSGIFVWKAHTILAALEQYEPVMHARLVEIGKAAGRADFAAVFAREFAAIVGKSVDYAVLERHAETVVVEAPFNWDDVGSWQSLARLLGTDEQGNTVVGKHLGVRTKGSIVRSAEDHLIVTLGLSDCLVVHTPDATLVANKHDEEAIREVVKLLQDRGWGEYL